MALTKSVIRQWTVLLVIVLFFCTVLSHVISQKLLPVIETVSPERNILKTEITVNANVENKVVYEQDQAPVEWTVKQVYVQAGDTVKKGTPLFQIDVLEINERIKKLEASIQEQKNNINAYDWTGGDRLVLNMKLEADEMEYQRLTQSTIPKDGMVLATVDGVINEFSVKTGDVLNAYETYIQYEENDSGQYVEWELSEEAGRVYREVETAKLTLIEAENEMTGSEIIDLSIKDRKQLEDGHWIYYSDVPEELAFSDSDTFQITMLLKENTYDYVVPRACVQEDSSGRTYIFVLVQEEGLFSKKYSVEERFVSVIDEDNLHAAIIPETTGETLSGCKVVSSASKAIEPGCEVTLLEVG